MLRYINKYAFSRVSQHLKFLNLKLPTTQQQVKTRYRQLAKQYHPDTLKDKSSKQSQQHFVQITTAYNYLKQLDQKQLTDQGQQYDVNMSSVQKQKVKTKQQELRQQTYDYFRRKQFYAQKKKDPIQDKPLHKTIPQLFIGAAFLCILFGQWAYKTMIKTDKQFKQVVKQKQDLVYENVFKGFNSKRKYGKIQSNHHPQVITPKQQNALQF